MENIKTYFFDTYAFFEIICGNPDYEEYKKDISIITTRLNLIELHYGLLRLYGVETANFYFEKFKKFIKSFDDEIIKKANEFRLLNKRKNLSYTDCIGYVFSKKLNVEFLTGDKEFENFDGVRFIK